MALASEINADVEIFSYMATRISFATTPNLSRVKRFYASRIMGRI